MVRLSPCISPQSSFPGRHNFICRFELRFGFRRLAGFPGRRVGLAGTSDFFQIVQFLSHLTVCFLKAEDFLAEILKIIGGFAAFTEGGDGFFGSALYGAFF